MSLIIGLLGQFKEESVDDRRLILQGVFKAMGILAKHGDECRMKLENIVRKLLFPTILSSGVLGSEMKEYVLRHLLLTALDIKESLIDRDDLLFDKDFKNTSVVSVLLKCILEDPNIPKHDIAIVYLKKVIHVAKSSSGNAKAISEPYTYEIIFDFLFKITNNTSVLLIPVLDLVKTLSETEIPDESLSLLLRMMDQKRSQEAQQISFDILMHSLQKGHSPAYFEFENTSNKQALIAVNDYSQPFPPASGYTFMVWVRFSQPKCNSDIFTIVDDESKNRLRVSVNNGCLSLETLKTVVSVPGVVFQPDTWHHLAIAHHKPRLLASYALVYFDGLFVEQSKCPYMGHPGSARWIRTILGNYTGEMPNAAATMDIGPCYFIQESVLTEDEICEIYTAGFEYSANLRDIPFASSGISDDHQRSPNQETNALSYFKQKLKFMNIPEQNILLGLFPKNAAIKLGSIQKETDFDEIAMPWLTPNMSGIVVNSSPVSISKSSLMAYLASVSVVDTNRVTDSIWKIGSCPLLLAFLESCQVIVIIIRVH